MNPTPSAVTEGEVAGGAEPDDEAAEDDAAEPGQPGTGDTARRRADQAGIGDCRCGDDRPRPT